MSYWVQGDVSTAAFVALWLLKIASFAIGAFIFSVIFWGTKDWLEKGKAALSKTKKKK